jgi:hypothetical protein
MVGAQGASYAFILHVRDAWLPNLFFAQAGKPVPPDIWVQAKAWGYIIKLLYLPFVFISPEALLIIS